VIYVQERLVVPVGLQRELFRAVRDEYLPAVERRGVRHVGMWRVSSIKGDPSEVLLLWEADDWRHVGVLNDALSHGSDLVAWRERSSAWVRKLERQVLRDRSSGPSMLELLRRPEMASGFIWHETIDVTPNMESAYVLGIEVQLAPTWELRGLHLLALLQPVLKANEIVNIWAVEHGFETLDTLGVPNEDEFLNGPYWIEVATSLRQAYRSVLGEPTPGS
jgi:hypothetical protein